MGRNRFNGGALIFGAIWLLGAGGASGQDDASVWEAYEGVYAFGDGEHAVVFDVVDQMPDGAHQLVLIEARSGRARTLYPAGDGGAAAGRFEEGAGWFVRSPVERAARFGDVEGGSARRLALEPVDGPRREGRRVPVRTVPIRVPVDGDTLAGELLLPPPGVGRAPYPAVQMINGGGPLTRRSPRHMGLLLAARGVAAVAMDKRGTGESGGSFEGASLADFGADAAAVHRYLRAHPEIDASRIGVWAGSEGGLVAWYLVREVGAPALLVCRVCPTVPYGEMVTLAQRGRLEAAGLPPSEVDAAVRFLEAQREYTLEGRGYERLAPLFAAGDRWRDVLGLGGSVAPPDAPTWDWYRDFLRPDPREMYRQIDGPVYVILGGEDPRIPAELNARAAEEALAGRNADYTVEVVDGANHGLMVRSEGDGGEEPPLQGHPPGMLSGVVDWVVARLKRAPASAPEAERSEGVPEAERSEGVPEGAPAPYPTSRA